MRAMLKSLVREGAFMEGERTQGSARGRLGNWPFYLDNGHVTQRNNRSDVLSGILLSLLGDTLLFAKKNMIVL
jgi:hypothetical protein